MHTPHRNVLLATLALSTLAWVDPLYLPMIALGPFLTGFVAGRVGAPPRLMGATWLLAGLVVLVLDLAINGEDVAFHAGVALLTGLIATACAALGGRTRRRAQVAPASA